MKRIFLWLGALAIAASAGLGRCDEPKPADASEPAKTTEPAVYEVVLLSLKSDWQAMRYHAQSGEAWYAFQGNWKPVPEADSTKPPAGDYRLYLSQTGENDWIAIRVERKSGRTWRLAALKWVEMKVLEAEPPKQESNLKL
jgi:hypothetical protein